MPSKDCGSHDIFRTDWFFDNPFDRNWHQVQKEWIENGDEFRKRWEAREDVVLDYTKSSTKDMYTKGVIKKYGLAYDNNIIPGAEDLFPTIYENMKAIDNLYLLVVSVFSPQGFLKPHHGDNSGILRCHCTLTVPDDADTKLFVQTDKDEIHEHVYTPGKNFYFDNTLYHWAGNPSKTQERVNIFFDVWPNKHIKKNTGSYQEKHLRAIRSGESLNLKKGITKGII